MAEPNPMCIGTGCKNLAVRGPYCLACRPVGVADVMALHAAMSECPSCAQLRSECQQLRSERQQLANDLIMEKHRAALMTFERDALEAEIKKEREKGAGGLDSAEQERVLPAADAEAEYNAKRWDCLALLMGYNELAKSAETIGAKMYLRMGRDIARKRYEEFGGKIDMTMPNAPLVIVDTAPPFIALTKKDIQLMRAAIAEYDQKKAEDDRSERKS